MSYRVDIPTLSANEVYTLTFEYEGTETIQLIVGDLTLETTDRRVVFTTTSPVNYIESNVNLINLNIYEGYYESDDFGGEYTQESYIEGKSAINLLQIKMQNNSSASFNLDRTENGRYVIKANSGMIGSGWQNIKAYNDDSSVEYWNNVYGTYTLVVDIISCTAKDQEGFDGLWFDGLPTAKYHKTYASSYNNGQSKKWVGVITTSSTNTVSFPGLNLYTATQEGEIIIGIMMIPGDYFDEFTKEEPVKAWTYGEIGCVKSPKVISREQPLNMFYCTDWTSTLNNGTVTCQDGKFYFDGNFSGYTWFDIINGGEVKNNIYLEPGSYYAKMKAHSKEPCMANGICVSIEATMENGNTIDLCSVYTSKDKIYNGVTETNKEFTSPIVKLTLKIWYGGNGNNNIIIDGIYLSKTNTTNDLAFKENHAVVTPDDLELYSFTDAWDNITITDSLDLTTGIVTKNMGILDITDINTLIYSGYDSTNDLYNVSCSFANFPNIVAKGNDTLASSNILERKWYTLEGLYSHGIGGKFEFRISGTRGITSGDEARQWVIDNLIMFYEKTPETIQLDIPPLKSYRNGSIQTSSQQLTPTLTTTLPISNKFTTTNLTSGSTYNVYFDGTATKLDAGGTIITNPISPCEVECGGTTLTIEGTDIQNVRVIETTVKNEVGSVCGTTDVELSKVKCVRGIPNLLSTLSTDWENGTDYGVCIRYKYGIDVQPNEKYVFTVSNTGSLTYKEIAIWNTDTWVSNTESIITTQRLTANTPCIFTVPSGVTKVYIYFPYDNTGNLNQAHEYELRMQEGTVDLGYGGQKEATIPLVCSLEQPIKLRSLGTTYDSYNPVTGELIKRIGVSETDGSYSVLSSPIVSKTTTDKFFDDFNNEWLSHNSPITNIGYYVNENSGELMVSELSFYTDYLPIPKQTRYFKLVGKNRYKRAVFYDTSKQFVKGFSSTIKDSADWTFDTTQIPTNAVYVRFSASLSTDSSTNYTSEPVIFIVDTKGNVIEMAKHDAVTIPQLYTNGQVKVYSDSEVYPTTILNGQSTNNYEINELNTSNNYTIRYDGECESINLANKSNTQGNNVLVKAGATSGNLTFVNGVDIDNVLLVQNDVREQEINHFNGLQTVEVSGMMIETSKNMWWNDWITPSQFDSNANYFADSAQFIPTNGGETIYLIATERLYYSLVEFDENYNRLKFNNVLIANPQQSDVNENGYYKNYIKLQDNTKYVKFVVPVTKANTQTTTPIFTYSKEKLDEPILSSNAPYQIVYINLPQPVQLNSLPDGTCDTYNPITGEYVQNVGYFVLDDTFVSSWRVGTIAGKTVATRDLSTQEPNYSTLVRDYSFPDELYDYQAGTKAITNIPLVYNIDNTSSNIVTPSLYGATYFGNHYIRIALPFTPNDLNQWNYSYTQVNNWLRENPIHIVYKRTEPITTQLTPITIPTFEGGMLQLITTDGKVFPMIEYSMPTNNRYDTSSWETGAVYTQRNMTEAYFNESTTPMIPTETMTLTTDHISSGSIILNDNGNGLIVLKGNYTGRDIPYFTGMRSVEAIEVETTPSPDQPLFGKGGRK